jgi:hypothetical protein
MQGYENKVVRDVGIEVQPRRAFVTSSVAVRNSSMIYFNSSIKSEPVISAHREIGLQA